MVYIEQQRNKDAPFLHMFLFLLYASALSLSRLVVCFVRFCFFLFAQSLGSAFPLSSWASWAGVQLSDTETRCLGLRDAEITRLFMCARVFIWRSPLPWGKNEAYIREIT